MEWYQLEPEDAYARLKSSPDGLSSNEASDRLRKFGPNSIVGRHRKTVFNVFIEQFRDFMILILIAAAIISGLIGDVADTVVILAIVVLNAVIGFIQEYRAERATEALQDMAAPNAVVVRDGSSSMIPAADLTPGDLVVLEAGDIVPADIRLIHAVRLNVEEAALTGESIPAIKDASAIRSPGVPLGDRKNLCFKGTVVTYGRGRGIVVATGMNTELGKIATMLREEKEVKTPLQKRLTAFGRWMSVAVLAICVLIFFAGVARGEGHLVMFLTAISLAVAAIPEALPAVVTVSLALGARKLAVVNSLVRKLSAVETLGSVTVICTDKTGTLTLNRMTVQEVYYNGRLHGYEELDKVKAERTSEFLLAAMALCNEVRVDGDGNVGGDPTEVALYAFARSQGVDGRTLAGEHVRISDLPFDSERKLMTTLHERQGEVISFTKGAPEFIMEFSDSMHTAEGLVELDRNAVGEVAARMAADGLRVLGLGMRRWSNVPDSLISEEVERGLIFLGLVGMMDPPREEAHESVKMCKSAGITPVMITGDHPKTALAIAGRLGIVDKDGAAIMTGEQLAALSLPEFEERVGSVRVYARVAPEQKLKIVKALQDRGEFVAMTGDGVNDAPALKRADIGIAMGITGTDAAKESAHMILLDDNFATIVKAVREGRRIYDNIRKFIRYLLTTNSAEILVVAAAPFLGLPMPLVPVQILWINLMTDALPALALSLEPAEGDVMARPPRPPRESIFAQGLGIHVIWVGVLIGILVLGSQAWSLKRGDIHWQSMTFTVLCFTQLFHVIAIRSERRSLFTIGFLSNKALVGAVLVSFALQLATIYVPFLNRIFRTQPMEWYELLLALAVSSVVFFCVEFEKFVLGRKA